MAFDFKKEYKEFYLPKKVSEIVDIPCMNYAAVRGSGNPNEEGGAYQHAIGVLYAVSYTIKMSYKGDYKIKGFFEYVVPPLEGFWRQNGVEGMSAPVIKCNTNSQLKHLIIHSLAVMLEMRWLDKEQMVSHKRSTTCSKVAKSSLQKPRLRISFQICSIGFISGV